MNLAHDEQFIVGMGYCDGYFGERTRPLLWRHWTSTERAVYMRARFYGGYVAHRKSIRKLAALRQQWVAANIRALFGGFGIKRTSEKAASPTGR